MANRYWVGGAGTWNTTSTTNWSASSGGASGASVPTAADSVFFDQAGTYTVTMTGALACLDITVSAGTVTFATGTSPTLNIAGSMSLLAGTVWSSTGAITFSATTTGKTVTTNGTTISAGSINFNGVGGVYTLGSALTLSGSLNVTQGTFDTGSYNLTATTLTSNNPTTRTINLGASTVNLSSFSGAVNLSPVSGLTFNAGTSQVNLTASSTSVVIDTGVTFYNIAFTGNAVGTKTVTGANTYNNFAVTAPLTTGTSVVTFSAQQTINGTLSTTSTAGNRRVFFASATYGIAQDLVVNSAPSLTDADFRGLYVRGTAAPISGTRIGNRGECRNITFSTPKTVYWNLAAGGNWSSNAWATSSGGAVSTDNFPLPQDTATIVNTGLNASASITLDTAIAYVPTVNMSGRTTAMTLSVSNPTTVYGNWVNGSGTSLFGGTSTLTFSGGGTQTITSAGVQFYCAIIIDSLGGTVQLTDANIGASGFGNRAVTNGTFDTQGYALSATGLTSANSNVRQIKLGASTVTLTGTQPFFLTITTNLTFDTGTSNITCNGSVGDFTGGGNAFTFYNLSYTNTTAASVTFNASCTCNNLTFTAPTSGISTISLPTNQTVNGTLTCAGASAVRRVFLRSDTLGTQRTLTVAAISATDCDFRDINLAGAASGASPTRAGNCGGNTGITFPAAKTVYWNLAGAQNWSATGWATGSGGAPAVNNFPLAQDTAVFDNTGSVTGTITIEQAWNIGTFDASGRTSAMTLTTSTNTPAVYGDWKFGTGVTSSSTTGTITFSKPGTQTITSNGVQFGCNVNAVSPSGIVQLADALSLNSARTLTISAGTFDAVTYNVTTGLFSGGANATLRMGTGTWTLSGTGIVWTALGSAAVIAGTSTIVLSDTSTTARTFAGGGLYYNKLTIGGTTGISTLTITGANTFGELASTKTVAHTITLPSSTTTTIGKWSVTGTAGNVVTVGPTTAASAYTLSIAGPANTGIDYLSISYCAVSTTSPGEFYVGVNSTNTAGNTGPIFFTATPAARTLYWVGGTGNWSSTTKWSTSSGGASGAAIPTSLDAVVFDSASNATAYTATIDAGVTLARCASFTMAGPLIGNVTFAGTVGIAFHGNVSFAATGITRTYTGVMNWAGNASYTFTTNGLALASNCTVNGVGSTWTLGSALDIGTPTLTVTYGTFNTSASNYAVTLGSISSNNSNIRTITLNSSSLSISQATFIIFTTSTNLTFNANTSTITSSSVSGPTFNGGGLTFYNISFTGVSPASIAINQANTFNNLSFTGRTTVGITPVTFNANQTINGTLTVSAGTASAYRTFLSSDTLGTTRTLTCAAVSATDVDFRDITIAGAAAPISGTRLGDAKGNSGITFPAAKTVYWALASGSNWGNNTGAGSWSATSGGAAAADQFPLPQDTAYIPFAAPTSGQTITVNAGYNIGTIDMSNRNASALVTLSAAVSTSIYGNWINGTGTTLSGTSTLTFAGRTTQQITSAGKTFTQGITINTPGGSVTLQDAFSDNFNSAAALSISQGTFDASTYNVTLSGSVSSVSSSGTGTRTVAVGSGTWTIAGSGTAWNALTSTNLTVTGTGTISLTNASAKTFSGGGVSYSGITLNQGGAGLLTITGNNTFKTITNTYSATGATSIALGNTTQTLTNSWTATGAATRVLTVSGTSAASPGTLIYTGAGLGANTVDYLSISNVRAYDLTNEWYAGVNSTNGGSLGWYFVAAGGTVYAATISETGTGTDSILARAVFKGIISETGTGTDSISAALGGVTYLGTISELATGSDAAIARAVFRASLAESGLGTDTISAKSTFGTAILESATLADTDLARLIARATLSETATGSDTESAKLTAQSTLSETATGTDTDAAQLTARGTISETATGTDAESAKLTAKGTITETASGSDTEAAKLSAKGTIAETATGTDTEAAKLTARSTLSETATATQTDVGYITFPTAVAETATGTDTDSAKLTARGTISETATGTDAISARAAFRSAIAESATITDLIYSIKGYFVSILESATGTDAIVARYTTRPSISETASITDANVGYIRFPTVISETATGSETVSSRYIARPNIAETATGTETVSSRYTTNPSIAETATGTETVSPRYIARPSIVESASITDAVAARYIALPSIFESANGSDLVVGGLRFVGVVAETATGTDTGSARLAAAARIAETASGSDTDATRLSAAGIISETATGTDALTTRATFGARILEYSSVIEFVRAYFVAAARVTELATGSDQVSALRALAARVVETATLTDSLAARVIFLNTIRETAYLQDAVNAPGSVYNILMREVAIAQDAIRARATFPSTITETATGTETNRAAFIPRATITESATITDAASALPIYAARILETSAAADSVLVAPSVFNAIAVASATAIDNLNAPGSIYNVTVPESATLSDSVLGAYLWNNIDDSQPGSWQNILDAQSVTWNALDASQTAGWNNVDNAQTTAWGNADSAQSPGWQNTDSAQTTAWNAVDDSQSVNWQNVVDAQSGTWTDVNDSQTAGWSNTGNAQSTSWGNIDDDQDPNWQDIPTLN